MRQAQQSGEQDGDRQPADQDLQPDAKTRHRTKLAGGEADGKFRIPLSA
jgi:hypothetical protein